MSDTEIKPLEDYSKLELYLINEGGANPEDLIHYEVISQEMFDRIYIRSVKNRERELQQLQSRLQDLIDEYIEIVGRRHTNIMRYYVNHATGDIGYVSLGRKKAGFDLNGGRDS